MGEPLLVKLDVPNISPSTLMPCWRKAAFVFFRLRLLSAVKSSDMCFWSFMPHVSASRVTSSCDGQSAVAVSSVMINVNRLSADDM